MTVLKPFLRVACRPAAIISAALGLATLQVALPCVADDVSPVRAYYDFIHWVSMGRADLASEQFTDDAVVIAGPDCPPAVPCIGRAAIRDRYIRSLSAGQTPLPLRDQRFDGQSLRTHGETILQEERHGGVVRLVGGYVFEFHDGLISSLRVKLEAHDPATAALQRRWAETALSNR